MLKFPFLMLNSISQEMRARRCFGLVRFFTTCGLKHIEFGKCPFVMSQGSFILPRKACKTRNLRAQLFHDCWFAWPVSVHVIVWTELFADFTLVFTSDSRPWAEDTAVKRVEAPLCHFGFVPLGGSDSFWKHLLFALWVDVNVHPELHNFTTIAGLFALCVVINQDHPCRHRPDSSTPKNQTFSVNHL